jgi:hypothetical protein
MDLKDCFKEDFIVWLASSNNIDKIVEDSLQEILDILLREPLSDYFWYGYPEYGGRLTYALPSSVPVPVPGDSLRVDGEKIKIFLRDYKIGKILE